MPRRGQRDEAGCAHREFLAVANLDIDSPEQRMRSRQDFCTGEFRQGGRAELEVLLTMGFDAIGNAQVVVARELEILCHVTPRIDDDCQTVAATENIRIMA